MLNGGTAWVGKRYYSRPDIHMIDMQYINMNGTGAGLDKIPAGPGKFSYAFFKDNDINIVDAAGKVDTTAARRQNLIYGDIPVNGNGTIDVAASIITAQGIDKPGSDKHDGWQLSVFHKQVKLWGERTPVWNFGMEFIALVQRDKSDATGSSIWSSIGARPVFALSRNLKVALELGADRVTAPNEKAQRLTKITLAPSISAGPGLWSRPELQAFVTYGKWNDAARAAVNASNNSGPVYNNGNSGTSFGFQVENSF